MPAWVYAAAAFAVLLTAWAAIARPRHLHYRPEHAGPLVVELHHETIPRRPVSGAPPWELTAPLLAAGTWQPQPAPVLAGWPVYDEAGYTKPPERLCGPEQPHEKPAGTESAGSGHPDAWYDGAWLQEQLGILYAWVRDVRAA